MTQATPNSMDGASGPEPAVDTKPEGKTLDLNPEPKSARPMNRRLMGVAIFVAIAIVLVVVYGIKKRQDITSQAVASGAQPGETGKAVSPISPSEAKALITSLNDPTTPRRASSTPTAAASAPGAPPVPTIGNGAPSATQPDPSKNPVGAPPYRPQSINKDPIFDRSFFPQPYGSSAAAGARSMYQPGQQPNAKPPHVETEAEEFARLEREAIRGPKSVSLDPAKQQQQQNQQPGQANSPLTGFQPTALPNMSSGMGDLASLYKTLLAPAAGQTPPSAPMAKPVVTQPTSTGAVTNQSLNPVEAIERHLQDDNLQNMRMTPPSPYEISKGWNIPAHMEQAMTSVLAGDIRAMVDQNVYDTATGKYLLIPKGSRLIGTYNENTHYGQNAIPVIWTQIVFPDNSTLDLDGMLGQDEQGRSGLRGKTDNHYRQLIGAAALSSILSAVVSLTTNRSGTGYYPSWQQSAAAGAGQSIQETGSQLTRRALNLPPTILVPAGQIFNVYVNKAVRFDGPYKKRKPLLPEG